MIFLSLIVAALLCACLVLASYLHLLYSESLRIRPREAARALAFFEESIRLALGFEPDLGVERFAAVKQCMLVLLTFDLALLFGARRGLNLLWGFEVLASATALIILFAYVVPHVLVTRTEGRWALQLLLPARLLSAAVSPFLLIVGFGHSIADLGVESKAAEEPATPEENIEALIEAGQEEGLLGEDDRKLIQSVVEFGDKTVREVMTPRPKIVAIEASASLEQLRQLLITERYSRIPAYRDSIDDIQGFVHARDMLDVDEQERESRQVGELVRPVLYVPETKRVNDLMREMQEQSLHMSVVIDEYGNTAGLATMEDLVEEIVGEIRDESEPVSDVVEEPDHSFVVSGDLDLDRLKDLTGYRPDQDLESTTIAGLVTERLGHVPAVGETLQLDGIRIEVLASTGLRVERLRVRRVEEEPAELPRTA
ncbi:MAG: HlyC/CorC family transporter [Acidobacteria bacterium]|nr:HlyC/CorC family transporter [Acidobacteriota bacterium]